MKFLSNPWFTGIVASIIAGLILYFIFGVGKAKSKQKLNGQVTIIPDNSAKGPIPGSNVRSTTPTDIPVKPSVTPDEIDKYLDHLPPLQREASAQNYVGIKVSWAVKLKSSFTSGGKQYLMLTYGSSIFTNVMCQIDLAKYPEIRVMKEGHPMIVEGTISSVERLRVNLQDCTFIF